MPRQGYRKPCSRVPEARADESYEPTERCSTRADPGGVCVFRSEVSPDERPRERGSLSRRGMGDHPSSSQSGLPSRTDGIRGE